ncbi:MAG: hypothetical protein GX097_06485 [Methanomicrobiales archaeon]|nr:hypothetical protein [Methanomicrobiales archaeon]
MAEFLDNTGSSPALTDLIKNSEKELYLISPYIKLTSINRNYIQNCEGKDFSINIIHRDDAPLKNEDLLILKNLKNVRIYSCADLHAKCYLNENFGVISTMNMYEHSQTSNWEMGVKFSKKDDRELFDNTYKEILSIVKRSTEQPKENVATKTNSQRPKSDWNKAPQKMSSTLKNPLKKGFLDKIADSILGETGYCIRCGEMTGYNPEKPFCETCYPLWAKFNNPSYREKYCHICGEKASTTKVRPVCNDCYNHHFR